MAAAGVAHAAGCAGRTLLALVLPESAGPVYDAARAFLWPARLSHGPQIVLPLGLAGRDSLEKAAKRKRLNNYIGIEPIRLEPEASAAQKDSTHARSEPAMREMVRSEAPRGPKKSAATGR